MKLLKQTLFYFILIAIPIFILGSFAFYFFLQHIMIKQVDESLKTDKQEITSFVNNNKNDVTELYKAISCTYFLKKETNDYIPPDRYAFVYLYDSIDMEYKPFRELTSSVTIKNVPYRLVMRESFVENDSVIYSILFFGIVLIGLLSIGITILNWYISARIWTPFYQLLNVISTYFPGKNVPVQIKPTRTKEFISLKNAIEKMIERTNRDFNQQKKYIDHIAHELQTPLAIANSQLELFIQNSSLDSETADLVDNLDKTLLKLNNISKALLLLSRIQNDQFSQKKVIDLTQIIHDYFEVHQDQISIMNIDVNFNHKGNLLVNMNDVLANILIGNLLSNAIKHNHTTGYIKIEYSGHILIIVNSGNETITNTTNLFTPYVSTAKSAGSLGIGLSIVKEICDYYHFKINFVHKDQVNKIEIDFNPDLPLDSL